MKAFIVFAHPEPKSFNGAMFDTAVRVLTEAGHEVVTSDLNRMHFNPVSDRRNFLSVKDADYLKLQIEETFASENNGFSPEIETELRKLEACDLLILQFPLWWFGLPAILKGWVDRVFAMGRTYGYGHIYESGKFHGKRAMLSLTTGGPAEAYLKGGFNGDIGAILRPIHRGILQFVGFDVLAPQIHCGPVRASDSERVAWLDGYAKRLRGITDEKPVDVGIY
jgi:NAD(P)H dehydrogenase (quinone)